MELFNYYSLDECLDLKKVKKILTKFEKEGKIEHTYEGDVLKIKDLDLDENEVKTLVELFDNNDVFPYPDYISEEIDNYDVGDGYDEYDDYDDEDDNY